MKATASCITCGGELSGRTSRLGALCPACVIRASCTPGPVAEGSLTTWAEVFPQLVVKRTLREEDGLSIYLAEVVGESSAKRAVLQVASGKRFAEAGGAQGLTARAQRLSTCEIEGLAPVLDFGDLADAFFLVTEAPALPSVPEALAGKDARELSALVRAITEESEAIVQAGRTMRLALQADPDLCFVEEKSGTVVLTPQMLAGTTGATAEAATVPKLSAGDRLGAFRLEEMVGEGGFGKVWRARQERPVERQVAVKVLKSGLHSQRARARFEVEQQSLAKLDHPHIARFFDGGTTAGGRPYFAMEWIDGPSLARFVNQRHAALEERLRLFRQVCEAVHYAHQKGIIHRDLKSSNVMVTESGERSAAKVIDFGIARAVEAPHDDQAHLTRAEEVLGTPAAMSPEQAAGAGGADLDARTDVYGLGVLLYELLSGALPFDPKLPVDELRRRIREEDPPKPSSGLVEPGRARQVRGDLDWITMRCLEKDPDRRYRSASALLRDLERHAEHQPVEAGPPELSYRAMKFVRRNRAVVAGSLVALAALLTGLILAVDGYRHASLRAVEAQEAKEDAEREAALSAQVQNFLQQHFFGQLNPENNPKSGLTLEEAVTRAADALEAHPFEAPQVEGEIRMTLGDSLAGLGRYTDAEFQYRVATERFGRAFGTESDTTMNALAKQAGTLSKLGQHEDACDLQQQVVNYWENRSTSDGEVFLRARRDLANHLIAAYRMRDGIAILEDVFEEQRERYGIDHIETLESLALLSKFYASEDKNFAKAAKLRAGLEVRYIYEHGSADLIASLHEIRELWATPEEVELLQQRVQSAGEAAKEETLEHLRLRVEYAKALGRGDNVSVRMAVTQMEPLLAKLGDVLGPNHPDVLTAYERFLAFLYWSGEGDRIPALVEQLLAQVHGRSERFQKLEPVVSRATGYFGQWDQAIGFYVKAAPQLGLAELEAGTSAALAAGDAAAYEVLQHEVLDRYGGSDDPYATLKIASILLNGLLLKETPLAEDLAEIEHYLNVARREQPLLGKTLIAEARLAILRERWEQAAELLERIEDDEKLRWDLFDSGWKNVLRLRCAYREGRRPEAERLLSAADLYWKRIDRWSLKLNDWPHCIPFEAALDQAERDIPGRSPEDSRLSPDRFGASTSAYQAWFAALAAWDRAAELNNEASELTGDGRHEEALLRYQDALELLESSEFLIGHQNWMITQRNIAGSYWKLGRFGQAIDVYRKSLERRKNTSYCNDADLETERAELYLAMTLNDAERSKEAFEVLHSLVPALEAFPDRDGTVGGLLIDALEQLAEAHAALGEDTEAATVSQQRFEFRIKGFGVGAPLEEDSPPPLAVLVPPTSEWRWLHPTDGIDPAEADPDFHRTFFETDFNESAWKTGRDSDEETGGFGYGDSWFNGVDIGTPREKALGKSAYFRHRFATNRTHTKLELRCRRDDGIIVYLDGVEVARDHVGRGAEGYRLPAAWPMPDEGEKTVFRIPLTLPKGSLPPGEHVLAISLHNPQEPSSDLRIGGITLVEVE